MIKRGGPPREGRCAQPITQAINWKWAAESDSPPASALSSPGLLLCMHAKREKAPARVQHLPPEKWKNDDDDDGKTGEGVE